ncbi:unnamed protein product [Clavelina lepadiformis]|uniref:Uncharacterized protein n=1 Tax=Clavelina lepadiformis TaxID=159417 RepID=A0ABP0G0H0_CLALP
MPYLCFTMVTCLDSLASTYTASVTPGFEQEILRPVMDVLRSFYERIEEFKVEEDQSSKCSSYEFDDPVERNSVNRDMLYLHPGLSKDDIHIALVHEMEKFRWKWIIPNKCCYDVNTEELITTWTFKRCDFVTADDEMDQLDR